MTIIEEYKQRLINVMKHENIELVDFSSEHGGHGHGCESNISHLKVIVKNFEELKKSGHTRISIHKLINAELKSELASNNLHALQIILI